MKQTLPILAVWLHDIGKFSMRANAPCSRDLEPELCPGGTSHVLYTHYFIEHVLPLPPALEGDRGQLARLASAHHRPDASSVEERVLQQADSLAAGGDALQDSAQDTAARLESVFTRVWLNGKGFAKDAKPLSYRLLPLDAESEAPLFPVADASTSSYEDLYKAFLAALTSPEALPVTRGVRSYLSSLVSLLERYTWCIPLSDHARISLYGLLMHQPETRKAIMDGKPCGCGHRSCPVCAVWGKSSARRL